MTMTATQQTSNLPTHRYTLVVDGPVPADRDFEATWTPEFGAAPGRA